MEFIVADRLIVEDNRQTFKKRYYIFTFRLIFEMSIYVS